MYYNQNPDKTATLAIQTNNTDISTSNDMVERVIWG